MSNFSVLLSKKSYTEKPKNAGFVRAEITQEHRTTARHLANCLINGFAVIPAVSNVSVQKDDSGRTRYRYDFVRQQAFFIDIDNADGKQPFAKHEQIPLKTAVERLRNMQIYPAFAYWTFSNSQDCEKYRICVIFAEPVTDREKRDLIQRALVAALGTTKSGKPYADTKCTDTSRLFYGTNQPELPFTDFDAVNDADSAVFRELAGGTGLHVPQSKNAAMPKIRAYTQAAYSVDTAILDAIQKHDSEYIRNRLNYPHRVFNTAGEMWDYIYQKIDFAGFLAVPENALFSCCLDEHADKNPSANIFKNEAGVWLYHCFSHGIGGTYNIRQFIEKAGGFRSVYSATEFLKSCFNIELKLSDWQQAQISDLDFIGQCLDFGTFAENCPHADRITRYCKDIFRTMLQQARTYCFSDKYATKNGEIVFFITNAELLRKSGRTQNSRQAEKISRYIAVLSYLNMIRKLPDSEIPAKLLNKARQIVGGRNRRHVQFYAIPAWVAQHTEQIENYGRKYIENGYRAAGISFELFCRTEGFKTAARVYPQIAQTKKADSGTTIQQDNRHEIVMEVIGDSIRKKGYARECEIMDAIKSRLGAYFCERQIKRSLPELLRANCWKRIRATKELKNKFDIESKGYPFLIVPE